MTEAIPQDVLEKLLTAAVLLTMRIGSAVVTMPIFRSPGVPARVKALFVLVVVVLLTPGVLLIPGTTLTLSAPALLTEVGVGLAFGLTLSLIDEALTFGAQLMSGAFSFSLVNMLDPNTHVETDVLGTVFGWFSILVLLTSGLHRTMLAALLRTLTTVPLGHAPQSMHSALGFADMASGIFFGGLQLAAPVVSAALLVEVAVGLVGRMAPALPAQIASVPVKTMVSYVVLVGALALWPGWIERHFTALLDMAQKGMRT